MPSSAPMEFVAPDCQSKKVLTLIHAYSSCSNDISIKLDGTKEEVGFVTSDGVQVKGLIAAARYIAGQSPRADQLLGTDEIERAKVSEILSLTRHMVNTLLDKDMEVFNRWLESRTFLVGNAITLGDLMLYAGVSQAAVAFPSAQHGHFCNLLRWYANIHYMADQGCIFPDAKFNKPRFKFVPPVVEAKQSKDKEAPKQGEKQKASVAAPATPAVSGNQNDQKKEVTKKESNDKKPEKKVKGAPSAEPTVDVLDIRVGVIKSIGPHPNADALYVEEIDLGEDKPRTVVSGLRKFVTEEEMQGRSVVVVCNLKPAKMRDIVSYGMVLCASNEDHTKVDPIVPPKGCKPGDKVYCKGYDGAPEEQINPKKKIFEKIAPHLKSNKDGSCMYKDVALATEAGPITCTIPNASIA